MIYIKILLFSLLICMLGIIIILFILIKFFNFDFSSENIEHDDITTYKNLNIKKDDYDLWIEELENNCLKNNWKTLKNNKLRRMRKNYCKEWLEFLKKNKSWLQHYERYPDYGWLDDEEYLKHLDKGGKLTYREFLNAKREGRKI